MTIELLTANEFDLEWFSKWTIELAAGQCLHGLDVELEIMSLLSEIEYES